MLKKRIIPKITVSSITMGNVRKLAAITTQKFERKRITGSPISQSRIYEKTGADQILIINKDKLNIMEDPLIIELIREIATEISMPVCFGGGIRSLNDCEKLFNSGIDKLVINTAAVENPHLISNISKIFGSQALCVCVDYLFCSDTGNFSFLNSNETVPKNSIIDWIKTCQDLGAGEIILSNVSRDGSRSGLDFQFSAEVRRDLHIPLLVSGGCSKGEDFAKAFGEIDADGVIAATFFAETDQNMIELKNRLTVSKIPIRGNLE